MTSFQLVASSVRTLELGSLGGVGGSASSCSERSAHGDARGQSAASAQRRCWVSSTHPAAGLEGIVGIQARLRHLFNCVRHLHRAADGSGKQEQQRSRHGAAAAY